MGDLFLFWHLKLNSVETEANKRSFKYLWLMIQKEITLSYSTKIFSAKIRESRKPKVFWGNVIVLKNKSFLRKCDCFEKEKCEMLKMKIIFGVEKLYLPTSLFSKKKRENLLEVERSERDWIIFRVVNFYEKYFLEKITVYKYLIMQSELIRCDNVDDMTHILVACDGNSFRGGSV